MALPEQSVLVQFSPDGRRRLSIIRRSNHYSTRLEIRPLDQNSIAGVEAWQLVPTTPSYYGDVATAWREALVDHRWSTQELPTFRRGVPRLSAVAAQPQAATTPVPCGWLAGWFDVVMMGSLAATCAVVWWFEAASRLGSVPLRFRPLVLDLILSPLSAWPIGLIVSCLPLTLYYVVLRTLRPRRTATLACRMWVALLVGAAVEGVVLLVTRVSSMVVLPSLSDAGRSADFPFLQIPFACAVVAIVTRRRWLGAA